jgi:hypothetical protein
MTVPTLAISTGGCLSTTQEISDREPEATEARHGHRSVQQERDGALRSEQVWPGFEQQTGLARTDQVERTTRGRTDRGEVRGLGLSWMAWRRVSSSPVCTNTSSPATIGGQVRSPTHPEEGCTGQGALEGHAVRAVAHDHHAAAEIARLGDAPRTFSAASRPLCSGPWRICWLLSPRRCPRARR